MHKKEKTVIASFNLEAWVKEWNWSGSSLLLANTTPTVGADWLKFFIRPFVDVENVKVHNQDNEKCLLWFWWRHTPEQRRNPLTPVSCLLQTGSQSRGRWGLLFFRHAAHRLQKVASLMSEGRPGLHPSLSSSPSFCSTPIPNLSAVSLSWLPAEGGARGGQVGVISLQQMMALRESVTLCRCPTVANYLGSSTGRQSARPRANALHVGH